MAANTPEMVEAHFGVPMTGAVLNTLNTRLDAEAIAFMLEHGEAKVLITDTEFSPTIEKALARVGREAAGDRHRRSAGTGRQAAVGDRLRGVHRRRRSRVRMGAPVRRVERDLAQLHVGDDRQSEGSRLSPSRRLSQCAVEHHRLGDAAARRLSVDAADVPLQRLVLSVDRCRQRRRQRLPAQGGCRAHLRCDPDAPGHALLRRADRPPHADQRAAPSCAPASITSSIASSRARRRRRRSSRAWSGSASTSRMCTD